MRSASPRARGKRTHDGGLPGFLRLQSEKLGVARAFLVLIMAIASPVRAQTANATDAANQEFLREQERERLLRQQQESSPDVRLQAPAAPSAEADRLPGDEKPCFVITRIALVGDAAERFQWALAAADRAGDGGDDPALQHCLGTTGINRVMSRVQNAIVARGYRRSGTLWEGRFRSCLLQEEGYLLECHRYIELNPVRAAMVEHPATYRWSSYRANAQGERSPFLKPDPLYKALGGTEEARQAAYRELFRYQLEPGLVDEIRSATNGNYVLGNSRFQQEIAATLRQRVTRGKAGRPIKEHNETTRELFA